jgi:hypothetical protein
MELLPAHQDAIKGLYDESVSKGLRGSELAIITRRGAAKPSDRKALKAAPLQ